MIVLYTQDKHNSEFYISFLSYYVNRALYILHTRTLKCIMKAEEAKRVGVRTRSSAL